MSRRYDSRTTIFSPEGRLYQVEYAMEAISHAGTCLGIVATDGIILAAEKKHVAKLLDQASDAEKIFKLDEYGGSVEEGAGAQMAPLLQTRSLLRCRHHG